MQPAAITRGHGWWVGSFAGKIDCSPIYGSFKCYWGRPTLNSLLFVGDLNIRLDSGRLHVHRSASKNCCLLPAFFSLGECCGRLWYCLTFSYCTVGLLGPACCVQIASVTRSIIDLILGRQWREQAACVMILQTSPCRIITMVCNYSTLSSNVGRDAMKIQHKRQQP